MKLISYNISHKLPDKAIYIMTSDAKAVYHFSDDGSYQWHS